MTAFEVGGDLDFVHGQERNIKISWHRFNGGYPISWFGRFDLLLAGDQSDRFRADPGEDLVIHLAGQQTQRKANDSRGMREHPFDRKMGLAGIGGAEDGGDAGAGRPAGAGRRMRKGHVFQVFPSGLLSRRRLKKQLIGTTPERKRPESVTPHCERPFSPKMSRRVSDILTRSSL